MTYQRGCSPTSDYGLIVVKVSLKCRRQQKSTFVNMFVFLLIQSPFSLKPLRMSEAEVCLGAHAPEMALLEKLELMKKECAKKEKKLEKARRAARVKAHVKRKIQEHNSQSADHGQASAETVSPSYSSKARTSVHCGETGISDSGAGCLDGTPSEAGLQADCAVLPGANGTAFNADVGKEHGIWQGPVAKKSITPAKLDRGHREQEAGGGKTARTGVTEQNEVHKTHDMSPHLKSKENAQADVEDALLRNPQSSSSENENCKHSVTNSESEIQTASSSHSGAKPCMEPANFELDSLAVTPSFRSTAYTDIDPEGLQVLQMPSVSDTDTFTLNLHSHSEVENSQANPGIHLDPDTETFTLNLNSSIPSQPGAEDCLLPADSNTHDTDTFTLNLKSEATQHDVPLSANGVLLLDQVCGDYGDNPNTAIRSISSHADILDIHCGDCNPDSPQQSKCKESPVFDTELTESCQSSQHDTELTESCQSSQHDTELTESCQSSQHETATAECTSELKPKKSPTLEKSVECVGPDCGDMNNDTNHVCHASRLEPRTSQSQTVPSSAAFSQRHGSNPNSEQFSEYTELDIIPFSQFELAEDFLSEASQVTDHRSSQSRCRRRQSTALVQRRSPRLSSFAFGSTCNDKPKLACSQDSAGASMCNTPAARHDSLFRLVRKHRKSKKALYLSSLFQYLIDEAKRETSFVEFKLPDDISGLVETSRKPANLPAENLQQQESMVHANTKGAVLKSAQDDRTYVAEEDINFTLPTSALKTKIPYQRSSGDTENDSTVLTDSERIDVIPETELIPGLESWYSGSDTTVVDIDTQETCATRNHEAVSVGTKQVVSLNKGAIDTRSSSDYDNTHIGAGEGTCENVSSKRAADSPFSKRRQTNKSLENTVQQDSRVPLRRVSLSRKGRHPVVSIKNVRIAKDENGEVPARLDEHSVLHSDPLKVLIERHNPEEGQASRKPELLPSPPHTPQQTVNADMADSPCLFTTQPETSYKSEKMKESVCQTQTVSRLQAADVSTPANMGTRCIQAEDNFRDQDGGIGKEKTKKSTAVFTPSKEKSSEKKRGPSILTYCGSAESGCKDPVVAIVAGTSDDEQTPYILSVQTTALTLWTQDDCLTWTAELHWYLPQDSHAEGACSIPSEDGSLVVCVRGSVVDSETPFADVFIYHWTTLHTHRFSLPLTSPVVPQRLFCHGLPTVPSTVLVFATDRAYTRGKTHMLDTSQGCVSAETDMEMVKAQLVDLQLVGELPDAAVGLTDDQKMLVWNVTKGVLLLTVPVPDSVPSLSRLFSSYFYRGYLLQHVQPVDGRFGPCLIAVNPTTSKGAVLRSFKADREVYRDCQQVWVYHDVLLALSQHGGLNIWDACSSQSLLTVDSSPGCIVCATVLNKDKMRWLVTGHRAGCLHIYSVTL
ncbi:hypothetical protein BaRGS_00037841 [Batillaria attramentaria]|uniref:Partner and localiser of BRCA2 WD40 domain-containing protein n=1 Tax=Batillaria attramentaria TaxID=370345 RepID=A0ABD0J8X0_9CAEN